MKILTPYYVTKVYSPNLLKNGNCEQGDSSPQYWTSSGANATTSITTGEYYSGSRGFKVIAGSDHWTSYKKTCDADTEYTFRGYVKSTSATLTIRIIYYTPYGIEDSTEDIITYTGTRGWKEYLVKFTTPNTAGLFEVRLLNTTGVAYFDYMFVMAEYNEFIGEDLTSVEILEEQERVKTARVTAANPDGRYSDTFNAGDYIEIWMGEGTNINKKFAGRLGSTPRTLGGGGATISIQGEHGNNYFYRDRCNGETYTGQTYSYIIKDLVEKHFSDITVQNVTTDSNSVSMSFTGRQTIQEAWDEIMERSGWIIYLDDDWDLHFEEESLTASSRVIEEGDNVLHYNIDFDTKTIVNAIRVVYGTDLDEVVEYEDQASIDTYGRSKEVVDLSYITTEADALTYAQNYVDLYKDPLLTGKVRIMDTWLTELSTYMTVTLKVNNEDLNSAYEIKSVTHKIDGGGVYSELELNSLRPNSLRTQADILRRLEALEEGETTAPTTKNIYKSIEALRARKSTIEVWTQGTGSSSVYGKALYGTGIYDPVSPTTWYLYTTVST
jgi:hypothetical protein